MKKETKAEIIKKLWKTVVGDTVVVDGVKRKVVEVVLYKEDDEQWINVVFLDRDGKELSVEEYGGKLSLWREIDFSTSPDNELSYEGEKFIFKKNDSGLAKTISSTEKGSKKGFTPYWIFEASSGRRVAVEVWDNKLYFYLAEPNPPVVSFPK